MSVDPQEFGEVKTNTEACKDGIERIENLFGVHLQNYRQDIRDLHAKGDAAHDRVDEIRTEYAKDKGKTIGFIAAISAGWGILLKYIGFD